MNTVLVTALISRAEIRRNTIFGPRLKIVSVLSPDHNIICMFTALTPSYRH